MNDVKTVKCGTVFELIFEFIFANHVNLEKNVVKKYDLLKAASQEIKSCSSGAAKRNELH